MDVLLGNEGLFLIYLFGGLGLGLFAGYMGKAWLYAYIITVTLYLGITEAKVIEVMGVPTTLGTALYSTIFFATDMLNERYGKQAGYAAVRYSVFAALVFQLFLQLTLLAEPISDVAEISQAMDLVYSTSLRIVVAGLAVYYLAQTLDVWLYSKIRSWTGERYLWLRNNGSTLISQAVDSYLFVFLAFYGVFDDWVIMATVGYGFKVFVAFNDTAFMYMSKLFTPRDLRGDLRA
jgi:uncharacterized integral membrane protein (TIGR00697 family)